MSKTNTLPITQAITNPVATLANSSSFSATNPGTAPTNTVLLATAGGEGSVLKSLMIASNDTAAQQISFWLSLDSGTTKYLLNTIGVPALSGYGAAGATVNIDVLGSSIFVGLPLDQSGRPVLEMAASARIYVSCENQAVTANKNIYVVGQQEDY